MANGGDLCGQHAKCGARSTVAKRGSFHSFHRGQVGLVSRGPSGARSTRSPVPCEAPAAFPRSPGPRPSGPSGRAQRPPAAAAPPRRKRRLSPAMERRGRGQGRGESGETRIYWRLNPDNQGKPLLPGGLLQPNFLCRRR